MQPLLLDRHGTPLVSVGEVSVPTVCVRHDSSLAFDRGFWLVCPLAGEVELFRRTERVRKLLCGELLILTPSRSARVGCSQGIAARLWVACFAPDYFDSLPGGQLLYDRLTEVCGEEPLPVVSLDDPYGAYLLHTLALFEAPLGRFTLSGEDLVRHACSFLLLQVANALYRCGETDAAGVRHSHEIYRNFKRLLVANFRTQHHIAFYAEQLRISGTYLSRIVRRVSGRTVHAHVAELLCDEARKLLEETDSGVKEIAERLGFSDQSAFGKFYLKQTGCSPVRFRRRTLGH